MNNNFNNENEKITEINLQADQLSNIPNKKEKDKNFRTYLLYSFIFGFLIPLGMVLMFAMWANNQENKVETASQFRIIIIVGILFLVYLIFKEFFVCKVTRKVSNSSYSLSKLSFIVTIISIILLTLLLFSSINFGFKAHLYETFVLCTFIGLIIACFVSYIIAKKFALKEIIEHKKYLIIGLVSYIVLISLIFNMFIPSTINKFLFNTFGNTSFSSKQLKIELTDYYNTNCGTSSFTHDFNKKEIDCFENISIDTSITNKDINKLTNLFRLQIKNANIIEKLDFTANNKLMYLVIEKSIISDLNTDVLNNVNNIELKNNTIDKININDGKLESIIGTDNTINNLNVSGNSIKEINIKTSKISDLSIYETTQLNSVDITESEIDNVSLDINNYFEIDSSLNDENSQSVYVKIDKINNLMFENSKNINELLYNSRFVFRNMSFEDKKISLENNGLLQLNHNSLVVPKNTKVKELILENMIGIVKNHYYETTSCEDSGQCGSEEEQKVKIQGPESLLSDSIEIFDNDKKIIFKWLITDYENE